MAEEMLLPFSYSVNEKYNQRVCVLPSAFFSPAISVSTDNVEIVKNLGPSVTRLIKGREASVLLA